MANKKGIPNVLVQDAGRTQIPAGSVTVLGLGFVLVFVMITVVI